MKTILCLLTLLLFTFTVCEGSAESQDAAAAADSTEPKALLEALNEAAAQSGVTCNGKKPVIDRCESFAEPVSYDKVSGHFDGTGDKFAFYFPAKDQWQGRFFQRLYPLENEIATPDTIEFGAENGGYTVKTNAGSGYVLDAAAAALSRKIAAVYYGIDEQQHIYGYAYGGSGGSYQTIGAAENTDGVWDGFVPYITGLPTSIPNYFFIRAYARFFLEDKADAIAREMNPGGSHDPYSALETDLEKQIFQEVTELGIPLRAWEDPTYVMALDKGLDYLLGFSSTASAIDGGYVQDFWTQDGYLGTEESVLGDVFRSARNSLDAKIVSIEYDNNGKPVTLTLDAAPEDTAKTIYDVTLLDRDGNDLGTISGSLNSETKVYTLAGRNAPNILGGITEGNTLRMDNSGFLAWLAYHRHQTPEDTSYYTWANYRNEDGTPLYPQRVNLGILIANAQSGNSQYDGHFDGKMIMVCNLLDTDAYAWDGDWYSRKAASFYGDEYRSKFRLWYNDHADHIEFGPRSNRLVQYDGIIERALVDLSFWVEQGIEPAESTNYTLSGSQIEIPATANERRGVQPVVNLDVASCEAVTAEAGQEITFHGVIEVPENQGKIVEMAWDFLGDGSFAACEFGEPAEKLEITASYTFDVPGIYYPALRVTSEKNGNTATTHANVENLDRVRVTVQPSHSAASTPQNK